jgi:hypothetical protein
MNSSKGYNLDMVGVTGSIPVAPTIILLRANRFFKHSNAGLPHVVGIQQQFMPITPQSISVTRTLARFFARAPSGGL